VTHLELLAEVVEHAKREHAKEEAEPGSTGVNLVEHCARIHVAEQTLALEAVIRMRLVVTHAKAVRA
jgi:hypothetical protein